MQIVLKNKTGASSRLKVENKNNIGRVAFNKIAKLSGKLSDLLDVSVVGQQDGDVLVYNANTNNYIIKTLPNIDGGNF